MKIKDKNKSEQFKIKDRLKQSNDMIIKIIHNPLISKQKEIFNKIADERLDEITELDKKVNLDNLIYKYKDPTVDAKFDEFDNALNLLDKIREGEVSLTVAKNGQIAFKSNLSKIKK